MPVYPGTESPSFTTVGGYDTVGYRETLMHMFSHVGTHIDAPAHIVDGLMTLDEFPIDRLVGPALIIDCRDIPEGGLIDMERLLAYGDDLYSARFLIFMTGWDKRWATDEYYKGFPVVDDEVLSFIIGGDYYGIGFDTISLDPVEDVNLTRHNRLFSSKNIINIENLMNLDCVPSGIFTLACLPLKLANADGAPTRAVAIVE